MEEILSRFNENLLTNDVWVNNWVNERFNIYVKILDIPFLAQRVARANF
jgi:hypothetical protein